MPMLAVSAIGILMAITVLQAVTVNDFAAGSITFNGTTVVYRLFTPANAASGQKYPLVLALHGVGESGNNNTAQLKNGLINWAAESQQAVRPSYVLAPQCPGNFNWASGGWSTGVYVQSTSPTGALATVVHLMDSLITVLPVDTNRLYVTGLSMGGMGTWDLITRYPSRFAAAVPVCGAIDTTKLAPLATVPIWTYHGTADGTVPPLGTRAAIRKFTAMGQPVIYPRCGTLAPSPCAYMSPAAMLAVLPTAKKVFSELAGVAHNAWDSAYVDTMMFRWMFLQTRHATATIRAVRPYLTQAAVCNSAHPVIYTISGKRILIKTATVLPNLYISQTGRLGLRIFSKEGAYSW